VTACGFDLERTGLEMGPLLSHPNWSSLEAVSSGRVFLTDGNAYFNRSGPRLVDSLEILAEILHPERFDFSHEGRGWRRAALGDRRPLSEAPARRPRLSRPR